MAEHFVSRSVCYIVAVGSLTMMMNFDGTCVVETKVNHTLKQPVPLTYVVFCFEYRNLKNLENDDDILNDLLNIMALFIPTWHTPFIFQVLKAQEIIFQIQRWAVRTIFSIRKRQSCENFFRKIKSPRFPHI